jgi:DUF4097 and DUF4098 domain-containing protein YvlB
MGQQWTVEDSLSVELVGVEEISVKTVAGEVVVTTTDGPAQLEISGVEHGSVDVSFEDGTLTIQQVGDIERKSGLLRRLNLSSHISCNVLIAVPSHCRAAIATVSADIVVAGLAEPAEIKTVSGDITLKDMSERVEARTVSGDVEAFGLSGDLTIATVSGDIGMVNGTCRWLHAKTVSGDFTLDLALPHGSNYSIGTVSGDVSIRFPHDPSVAIEASSMSGKMRVDFDNAPATSRAGTRKFTGTYGAGDSRLSIKTISGDLQITRKEAAA